MNNVHGVDLLVRIHGEGQESALRELGIAVDEFVPTSLPGEFVFDADAPALPSDEAALVEGAQRLVEQGIDGQIRGVAGYIDETLKVIPALCALVRAQQGEIGRLARRLVLVEQHDTTHVLESQLEMLCEERAKDRDAHARERDGMLGDKAHLSDELDAMRDRAMRAEAFVEKFEPLLRAYHAGADRNQLKAACAERWGESMSTGQNAWDLVIAQLEEQSPKHPRSDEAMARRRRIADDVVDRYADCMGDGDCLRVGDGTDSLRRAYVRALDSLAFTRKALEEGRAVDGLYQSAMEHVIAIKAQIELDEALGIGGAS